MQWPPPNILIISTLKCSPLLAFALIDFDPFQQFICHHVLGFTINVIWHMLDFESFFFQIISINT